MKKRLVSIFLILFSLSFIYAQTSGGPDGFGYTWRNSNDGSGPAYSWITPDASATVVTGQADDNSVGPFPIGFNFPYYGADKTDFYLCSNGFIAFNNGSSLSNVLLPNAGTPNDIIAWFWDDLDPVSTSAPANNATVTYENITYDGGNALLVTFMNYHEYSGEGTGYLDAQVILCDDGDIIFQYSSFNGGIDQAGCTVGIENADGTLGLTYCYNDASNFSDAMAISFAPPAAGTPGLPINPNPATASIGVPVDGTLTWDFGADTDTYDLWFGPAGNMTQVVSGAAAGATGSYTYSGLAYTADYEWRVDTHNSTSGLSTTGISWTFQTQCGSINTYPFLEDFESASISSCWSQATDDDDNWSVLPNISYGPDNAAGGSTYLLGFDDSGSGADEAHITTNTFDITGLSNPTLSFQYWVGDTSYPDAETSTLYLDIDDGSGWTQYGAGWTYNAAWNEANIDLSAMNTTMTFRFRAVGSTSYQSDIGIDNFRVFSNATPPACVTTLSPADGTTDLLEDITLSWGNPGGATSYIFYFGSSTGNYDIVNGMTLTTTSYDYTATLGNTYYWMVVPGNVNGFATGCPEWSFSTLMTPPECSTGYYPTDADGVQYEYGQLLWNTSVSATEYLVYFGTSSGNYDIVNGMSVTGTEYDYSGLTYDATYYWTVRPVNGNGPNTTCPEQNFTVRSDPTIVGEWLEDFESGMPANWVNVAEGTSHDDDWAAETGSIGHGATSGYNSTGYIGFDDSGTSTVDVAHIETNPFDFSALTNPTLSFFYWIGDPGDTTNDQSTLYLDTFDGSTWTTYPENWGYTGQWTAVTIDLSSFTATTTFKFRAEGTTSYYSDVCIDDFRIFSNSNPPACTNDPTPVDASVDQLDSGALTWDEAFLAQTYKLYLGTDAGTYDIVNGLVLTNTSYNYTLSPAQTYYWKVEPGNANGYATGCPEWSFSTVAVTPGCAAYTAPADAAIDQLENGTLDWDTTDYASTYNLYFGTASGTYDIVNGMALTATSYDYSGLTYGNTYYWMVVPENAVGPATGCAEQSFTVRADPTITVFPWLEEFTSWAPTNWTLSGDRTWAQYGGEAAYCNFWGWSTGTAIMTTPPVQLPSTGMWALNFDWSHKYHSTYPDDQGIVQISTDGINWTELWNLTGTAFDSNDGAGDTAPGTGVTETFPLDAYLGQTVFFQVVGVSGYGPNFYVDNFGVNTYVPPTAKAKVNVFLGGAYSVDNDNMSTAVNGFLPATSPYADGIAVTAMPTDVVDWISVELRQTADGATIEQRSGLLLDSGMIVDVAYETDNTVDYVNFLNAAAGDYFVVLRHRNHSDIMSAVAATLPADASTATVVDFTSDAANTYSTGPAPVYEVETGVYAMYPGDINGDGSIIADDATIWQAAFTSGTPDGYNVEDLDFDSSVLAADNVVWKTHFSAGAPDSQVPDNSATATNVFSKRENRINRIDSSTHKQVKKLAR